ncbi:MAG: response regulator [Anaerolineae bacterium]|nr:response regulator [Anaerolineae bacterium]
METYVQSEQHTSTLNTPDVHTRDVSIRIERSVLASMSAGVVVSDGTGQITFLNQAAVQLLQVETDTVLGKPVRKFFQSLSAQEPFPLLSAIDRLYNDPYSYGLDMQFADMVIEIGLRIVQVRLSPVLTDVGEFVGIVALLHDITQDIEDDRAKSEFISNISHELRRPLTAIKGYSDLLLFSAMGALNEQQEHFLRILQNSADRLVALTNDLLDISHIETGRMELDIHSVQMEQLARDVVQKIQPQCVEYGVHLSLKAEPNVGTVMGDKVRLMQIITNLLNNALSCTPEGGRITVSLSHTDKAVRVDVADTGPGIPPEEQVKLFQRFYRVNNPAISADKIGTGLGLPIAKLLVEMHGGSLLVESTPGKGSVFTFVLPRRSAVSATMTAPEIAPSELRRTVLVVEDEHDISELIALQLRTEGFEVLTTARGEEALAYVHSRAVDLITLDMMLPDITGMEVLRRLKSDPKTSEIPVIVVSVIQPKSSGPAWGAIEHISKPFALDKLMESVRRTLSAAEKGRLTPVAVVE